MRGLLDNQESPIFDAFFSLYNLPRLVERGVSGLRHMTESVWCCSADLIHAQELSGERE